MKVHQQMRTPDDCVLQGMKCVRPACTTCSRLMACLCAGVLDATQETKISQVRAAALETLSALLDATGGGHIWPPELQARVRGRLQDAVATEKASVIRAQAAAVLKLATGQISNASREGPAAAGGAPQA